MVISISIISKGSPNNGAVTPGKETTIVETQSDNMISVTVHEIDYVELTDNGVFICTATNKLGDDERSTTLTVGCE